MVVVVPAFAHRDKREPDVVPAVVGSLETAFSPDVGQGIDGHRGMEQQHRRYKEAPGQQLQTIGAQAGRPRRQSFTQGINTDRGCRRYQ